MFARVSTALFLSLSLVSPVLAEDESSWQDSIPGTFSGTAAFTTDYRFRGISQSDEGPAAQLGMIYTAPVADQWNIYAGAWGSNVDYDDGDEAHVEIDGFAGVVFTQDAFSLDLGGIYYSYPGASDSLNYDYWEAQAVASYTFDFAIVRAAVNYSPDYFGASGDAVYTKLATDVPLPYDFTLTGRIAYQWLEDEAAYGVPDYAEWGVGVIYPFKGVNFGLEYADTNISDSDCADGCDATVLFTVSKSW